MHRDGNLETLLRYLDSDDRIYPDDADYLETIWFLAGKPKHLPPNILSSSNVSNTEHRNRLIAQVRYAANLGPDYLYRLAQYIYLIPKNEWIVVNALTRSN